MLATVSLFTGMRLGEVLALRWSRVELDTKVIQVREALEETADFAASIGLPEVTFHALRHTHASQLIDAGVDIVTISRRLGHAKPDITLRIYAHLFRKDDGKAAAAINAVLGP